MIQTGQPGFLKEPVLSTIGFFLKDGFSLRLDGRYMHV